MKINGKLTAIILAGMMAFGLAACGEEYAGSESAPESVSVPGSDTSDESVSVPDDGGEITYTPRARQQMPTAEIADKSYDYGDPSGWAAENLSSVDLGSVYLQDVIDDNVYDWGHSVIKEGDTYKMWWVRPATYDSVFYAESKDLKNWYNVERVISLSPNAGNVTKYDNVKGMLGKPSVIRVEGKYYMYFEAPATEDPDITQTVLEWDNQVMLATSDDGITWTFYSDEKGQPKPVVAMPQEYMRNFNSKDYGVGQPSAFYKDGKFYLTYCYVIYSQNIHEIRVAVSDDGINFGDVSSHKRISGSNGRGVTYDLKTGKYMMVGGVLYESDELDFSSASAQAFYTYDETKIQTSFYEFVKNEHGLVDTETFYVIHLQGAKSTTDDWRAGHTTWDGHIHAVNPSAFGNRTITLPNGGAATENNLKGYRDRANTYSRPTADAVYAADGDIKIDGIMDDVYKKATKIEITRPVYAYGSNLTPTWGEAYVAWNEDHIYLFARVYDANVDNSFKLVNLSQSYMHDGLDVFIDTPNDHGNGHGVAYGLEQFMVCTGSNNSDFIIKGAAEADITAEFEKSLIRHRVRQEQYGYSVEWRVPWYEFAQEFVKENACIGLDFQINDAMGNGVGREAMVVWSNNTGDSFRFTEDMGDVYLVKR